MIAKTNTQKFCCEDISKIENYKEAMADTERVWFLHHRFEALATVDDLKEMNMYFNRPAMELIFTNENEHQLFPHLGKLGKGHSKEWCEQHSKDMIGNDYGKYNKGQVRSKEQCQHISDSLVGKPKSAEACLNMRHPHNMEKTHWKRVDGHRVWY